MSASARYYECIEDTFEEVENRLEALESDPDVTVAEGVINVTFANHVVFVFSRQPGGGFRFVWREDDDDWFDTKTNRAFRELLTSELAQHAGEVIAW